MGQESVPEINKAVFLRDLNAGNLPPAGTVRQVARIDIN